MGADAVINATASPISPFLEEDSAYAEIIREYLVDSSGRPLTLSNEDQYLLRQSISEATVQEHSVSLMQTVPAATLAIAGATAKDEANAAIITGAVAANAEAIVVQMNRMHEELTHNIQIVNGNVSQLSVQMQDLEKRLLKYIAKDAQDKAIQLAETRRVSIVQELEQKFGHNKRLRRTAVGILQATDLSIVRKESVVAKSEDLMLETPNYWLAPALVSLSAWVNDDKEVAERAVKEAYRRDREKAALFYALVNRRAERRYAASVWLQEYLSRQQADSVDYKVIVLLNAYAEGLFGTDQDGAVMQQLVTWFDELKAKEGFKEAQIESWETYFTNIGLKRFIEVLGNGEAPLLKYHALRLCCPRSWATLSACMGASYMHEEVLKWVKDAVEAKDPQRGLKGQIDHLLDVLVSDFDEEELPYYRDFELNELIVKSKGNERFAKQLMNFKSRLYSTRRNFAALIADAARYPEETHASKATQTLAIGLELDWIKESYNNVVERNREKVPEDVEIVIDTWTGTTVDGRNEETLVQSLLAQLNLDERNAMMAARMKTFHIACLFGGAALVLIGIIMLIVGMATGGSIMLAGLFTVVGIAGVVYGFLARKRAIARMNAVQQEYREKRRIYTLTLRKAIAELVDWRREFKKRDGKAEEVLQYLSEIQPAELIALKAEKYE